MVKVYYGLTNKGVDNHWTAILRMMTIGMDHKYFFSGMDENMMLEALRRYHKPGDIEFINDPMQFAMVNAAVNLEPWNGRVHFAPQITTILQKVY